MDWCVFLWYLTLYKSRNLISFIKLGIFLLFSTLSESSSTEKQLCGRDLGVLVGSKLTVSEQCAAPAKKASRVLGSPATASPAEINKPLCHSAQGLSGHTCDTEFSFAPTIQKDVDRLERVPRKATKMISDWEVAMWGKTERTGFVQPREGEALSPCSSTERLATKKMETPSFYKELHWKIRAYRVQATCW